jgi:transcriptional regulator with XRE-family HTH domain
MTPSELRAALEELGMAQREFAFHVRVAPETVSRWINGHKPVPYWVEWKVIILRNERRHANG